MNEPSRKKQPPQSSPPEQQSPPREQQSQSREPDAVEEALQQEKRQLDQQRQELEAEAERLRRDVELMREVALRAQADLENYRKRAQREREEERRFAELELIRDLLPVCDNLEHALEAARKTKDVESLIQGFEMVAQQLHQVLRQHHCERLHPHGEPFDPHHHEAVAAQPHEEHPPQTVLQVLRPGYKLHDRVIRPAQVIVSQGAGAGDVSQQAASSSPAPSADEGDGKG